MEPGATATDSNQTPVQSHFINRTLNKINSLPPVRVSPVDTDVEHAVQTCLQLLAVSNFEFEAVHLAVLSDDNDSNLTIRLRNAPAAFMNLLRISFVDVPVMVIDEVTFKQVPLVVPTQLLAHRFGLLPVFVDPYTLDIPTLTFCAKGEVSSRQLQPVKQVEGDVEVGATSYPSHKDPRKPDRLHGPPSVHSDRSCVARWSSSKISGVGPCDVNSGQTSSRPVVEAGITITYLLPTQTIEGTATISKQTARTHAKAQAAKVFFRMHAVPVVNENSGVIDIEDAVDLCAKCPAGVFDIESNPNKIEDESTWLHVHNSLCEDLLSTASPISSSRSRSRSRKRQLKVKYADTDTKETIHVTDCDSPMLTFTVRSHLCTSCGRCRLPLREDEDDHILSVTSTSGLTASSVFYDALRLCKTYFD
jgi:DNA-directed RNA polymerase alpha subunit